MVKLPRLAARPVGSGTRKLWKGSGSGMTPNQTMHHYYYDYYGYYGYSDYCCYYYYYYCYYYYYYYYYYYRFSLKWSYICSVKSQPNLMIPGGKCWNWWVSWNKNYAKGRKEDQITFTSGLLALETHLMLPRPYLKPLKTFSLLVTPKSL